MKRCTYCGKQYSDATDVCSVDGQPVEDPNAVNGINDQGLSPAFPVFKVRLVAYGISSGLYRVYLRSDDLAFVQTDASAGQAKRGVEFLVTLLGPVGILVSLALRLWSKTKDKGTQSHTGEGDLDDRLQSNPKNFTLYIPEIRDAELKPSTRVILAGGHAGRLVLHLQDGRKLRLEFPAENDLKTAMDILAPRLGFTLRIDGQCTDVSNGRHGGKSTSDLRSMILG